MGSIVAADSGRDQGLYYIITQPILHQEKCSNPVVWAKLTHEESQSHVSRFVTLDAIGTVLNTTPVAARNNFRGL